MCIPTEEFKVDDYVDPLNIDNMKIYRTLSMHSIHNEDNDTKLRDELIKIMMFCKEFEIGSLVLDIEDMNKLFILYTPILGKAF